MCRGAHASSARLQQPTPYGSYCQALHHTVFQFCVTTMSVLIALPVERPVLCPPEPCCHMTCPPCHGMPSLAFLLPRAHNMHSTHVKPCLSTDHSWINCECSRGCNDPDLEPSMSYLQVPQYGC